MVKANITIGWQQPIWPDWSDDRPGGQFAKRNFWQWMASAGVDGSGGTKLYSLGLLGFYITLYWQYFDYRPS